MQAIVIPLKVSGIGQASRQIALLGQQMASLQGGAGGGSRVAPTRAMRTPPSLGQQVKNAVMSSRVSMTPGGGVQMMPLVNKLLPLFVRLPPIITVTTAAILAMSKAANDAANSLTAFRASQLTSGGSAQQTSTLRALGISPESAREFGRTISSDPVAAGYASRAGIYNPGGEMFGDTNTATNMLKWAEALRKMGQAEATRAARLTGTEDLLKTREMSERAFQQLKRTAKLHAEVFEPKYVQHAANLNAQMERLGLNFDRIKVGIGKVFIPILETAVSAANQALELPQTTSERIKRGTTGGRGMFDPRMVNPDPAESEHTRAVKDNTQKLKEIATYLRNGTYGGGERARGAVPANWQGVLPDYYAKQAAALGAFPL